MDKIVVEQQTKSKIGIIRRMIVKPAARLVANPYLRPSTDQCVVRMRIEECDLFGDARRIREIIVVLSGDVTPTRKRYAAIERCCEAGIRLMKDANARID